jgi:hypothetical protein
MMATGLNSLPVVKHKSGRVVYQTSECIQQNMLVNGWKAKVKQDQAEVFQLSPMHMDSLL